MNRVWIVVSGDDVEAFDSQELAQARAKELATARPEAAPKVTECPVVSSTRRGPPDEPRDDADDADDVDDADDADDADDVDDAAVKPRDDAAPNSGFLPLVLIDYLRLGHERGDFDLPQDALARWDEFDEAPLFAAAVKVLREGITPAPRPPPIVTLARETCLLHVRAFRSSGLGAWPTWLITAEAAEAALPALIEYVSSQNPGDKLEILVLKPREDLAMVSLGPDYTYRDLERYIRSVDPEFAPTFDDLGRGDNGAAADWLAAHSDVALGWVERPGALPARFQLPVEIMVADPGAHLITVTADDAGQ